MIWRWIGSAVVYAIHDRQIAEHGGLDGIRDRNAVESALARPQMLAADEQPESDAARLASTYAFGVAGNNGFLDTVPSLFMNRRPRGFATGLRCTVAPRAASHGQRRSCVADAAAFQPAWRKDPVRAEPPCRDWMLLKQSAQPLRK